MNQVKIEPEDIHAGESSRYVGELYMDIVKEDTEIYQPSDNVDDVGKNNSVAQPVNEASTEEDLLNISYCMMGPPKVCSKCNEAWQPELSQHECRFSDGLVYQCAICPEKFKFKQSLKKHEKSHLDSFNFKICADCGLVCENVYTLMHHMRQHRSRSSINYKCGYCIKGFCRKSLLDTHIRLEHQCSICPGKFKCKEELVQHTKSHMKRSRYQPQAADLSKGSISKDRLRSTKGTVITMPSNVPKELTQQRYSCEICTAAFASKLKLAHHISSHQRREGFLCPICQKLLNSYSRLKSHVIVHKFTKVKRK